jgi:hypothetical protein
MPAEGGYRSLSPGAPGAAGTSAGWRVRRAIRLGWRHRADLLRAPPLLVRISFRLRRHGYGATAAWLDRRAPAAALPAPGSGPLPETQALELAYVVRAAARVAPDATCLRRALVLRHLLGRAGIASTVQLGVRTAPDTDQLAFHAWVVVGDTVVSEPAGAVAGFVVLSSGQPPPGVTL